MTENEIIEALEKLNLKREYKRADAEVAIDLLISAYELLSKERKPEYLFHWRINKIGEAFSYLYSGWLGASANAIGLSFATEVSQDARHIKNLQQNYSQIEPHIANAIDALRTGGEKNAILSRYEE